MCHPLSIMSDEGRDQIMIYNSKNETTVQPIILDLHESELIANTFQNVDLIKSEHEHKRLLFPKRNLQKYKRWHIFKNHRGTIYLVNEYYDMRVSSIDIN